MFEPISDLKTKFEPGLNKGTRCGVMWLVDIDSTGSGFTVVGSNYI
jgi:hypothetical protein